ncbi:MAG: hypothetical protein ACWGNV_01015 [Bacteroidales bacterium]
MPGNAIRHPRTVLLILFLATGWPAPAQEQEFSDQAESALYLDEASEVPVQVFERMEVMKQRPIDLNNATRDQLYEAGLFTPFQVELILRYRENYGPLYSIYELAGLSGFRRTRLKEISSCITVDSRSVQASHGKMDGWALMEGSTSLPVPIEYLSGDSLDPEPRYPGSPFRVKVRVRADPSRYLSLGAAYEKDPGEYFFPQKKPEFLSGYISYKGTRWVKNLVTGTFRIHHGLGLVNGTGLIHALNSISLQPLSVPTLSPAASLAESKYEQGLAWQLVAGKFRCLCWASLAPIDLSLQQDLPSGGKVDWEEKERMSGLHRTTTEVQGRSLAFRSHHGALVSWRNNNFRIEAMSGIRINGLTRAGKDSLRMDPGFSIYPMGSLYVGWSGDRLQLAGEMASAGSGTMAFQMLTEYRFSDFLSGLLLFHHYGPGYRGMFPSSYGAGNKVENDQGASWAWHLEADRFVVADLFVELFRSPAPGPKISIPSISYRFGTELRNAGIHSYSWKIRAWKRGWQQTSLMEGSGTAPVKWSDVIRLDLQCGQIAGDILQWKSRLIISWYSRSPGKDAGYAAAQQLTWTPCSIFRATVQFVIFRVADWDNRIYLYEPGLYYHFQFPVCYGNGEKLTTVFTLKIRSHLTISWKMATLIKNSEASSASGDQMASLQRRWDLALQIRLQL